VEAEGRVENVSGLLGHQRLEQLGVERVDRVLQQEGEGVNLGPHVLVNILRSGV